MNEDDLLYALMKQVPAMRYRVTLATDFGPLKLVGRDANRIATLCEKLLSRRLERIRLERAKILNKAGR